MKRRQSLLVLAVAAIGIGVVAAERAASSEHVYSAAEVQQGRLSQPAAWVGRTVPVRGWLVGLASSTWGVILPPRRWMPCSMPRRSVAYATTLTRRQSLFVRAASGVAIPTSIPSRDETLFRAVLEAVACWPVVGSLVLASAVEQGMTVRVRVLPVRPCRTPVSQTCADAVLVGISQ